MEATQAVAEQAVATTGRFRKVGSSSGTRITSATSSSTLEPPHRAPSGSTRTMRTDREAAGLVRAATLPPLEHPRRASTIEAREADTHSSSSSSRTTVRVLDQAPATGVGQAATRNSSKATTHNSSSQCTSSRAATRSSRAASAVEEAGWAEAEEVWDPWEQVCSASEEDSSPEDSSRTRSQKARRTPTERASKTAGTTTAEEGMTMEEASTTEEATSKAHQKSVRHEQPQQRHTWPPVNALCNALLSAPLFLHACQPSHSARSLCDLSMVKFQAHSVNRQLASRSCMLGEGQRGPPTWTEVCGVWKSEGGAERDNTWLPSSPHRVWRVVTGQHRGGYLDTENECANRERGWLGR